MKFDKIFVFLAIVFLFSLSFLSASFTLGKPSSNITEISFPLGDITGWINLSFTNQNYNSIFKIGENSITLKELLDKNPQVAYNCSSLYCGMVFGSMESAGTSYKSFNFLAGENKTFGLKITEAYPINQIGDLILNITSNAGESCLNPLSLDLFDDGIIDFTSNKVSNYFCVASRGCYNSLSSSVQAIPINSAKTYCEIVEVNPAPALKIGARVINAFSGGGDSEFKFSVLEFNGKFCSNKTSASGEISCIINETVNQPMNITVCMNKISGGSYSIQVEDQAPICGSIGDSEWDMDLFAQPMKYGSFGSVIFNSSKMQADILSYISSNYNDCSAGCYVPLRLFSGVNQKVDINNVLLNYESRDVQKNISALYFLEPVPSLINSGFVQLNLEGAGFKTPLAIGKQNISLFLDSLKIINNTIENLNIPLIQSLSPLEVPLGVYTKFYVFSLGTGIKSYGWNFEGNATISSEGPTANYKYLQPGEYTIEVTAMNDKGQTKKQFSINVISPEKYINYTLNQYKLKIGILRNQLNNFSVVVKNYVNKKFDLNNLETSIQQLIIRFESAGEENSEYISIIDALPKTRLPDLIFLSEKASGKLLVDSSQLNVNSIKAITGETTSASDEAIKKAAYRWVLANVAMDFDLKSYSALYGDLKTPLVSDLALKLSSLGSASEVYVIVNKPRSGIEGVSGIGDLISSGGSTGFLANLGNGQSSFEFLIDNGVAMPSLPLYLSPRLSELGDILTPKICNNNKVCESSLGENSSNCSADCFSWANFSLYVVIILLIFLVVYIFVQEFYKRYYENKLFKNKNELFNLINFMDNAEKQGLKRNQIVEKLKNLDWSEKKINYAYKMYKGERKNSWEIPVFKSLEQKQVKSGLEAYKKNENVSKSKQIK